MSDTYRIVKNIEKLNIFEVFFIVSDNVKSRRHLAKPSRNKL